MDDELRKRGTSAYPGSYSHVKKRSSLGPEDALIAALAIYIVVLAVWPLARRSGELLGVLIGQWRTPAAQAALINTVEASTLATLVSVAIGTVIAFVLALTDIRAKGALAFVALLPLLVPSQITALAWIEL